MWGRNWRRIFTRTQADCLKSRVFNRCTGVVELFNCFYLVFIMEASTSYACIYCRVLVLWTLILSCEHWCWPLNIVFVLLSVCKIIQWMKVPWHSLITPRHFVWLDWRTGEFIDILVGPFFFIIFLNVFCMWCGWDYSLYLWNMLPEVRSVALVQRNFFLNTCPTWTCYFGASECFTVFYLQCWHRMLARINLW